MDIYERIKADHDDQRDLAKQIMTTSGDEPRRRELWARFRSEIVAHANAEEQAFYSRLMHEKEGQEIARHSVTEHKEADDLIEKLDATDMGSGQWIQTFEKLKDALDHHMEEEEEDVFAKAQKVLSGESPEAIESEYGERKQMEQARGT